MIRQQQNFATSLLGSFWGLVPCMPARKRVHSSAVGGGDQTTGRQGQLTSKFRSRLAAKLAASLYYVLFYYIDIIPGQYISLSENEIKILVDLYQ